MSVDPRVGLELEKLNKSCETINNLEVHLGKEKLHVPLHPHDWTLCFFEDELKRNYQELQETSQEEIKLISAKIKNAIDLAKPFYEARRKASQLLKDLKVDQSNHERAKTNLAAAKEMVGLAEESVTQVRIIYEILNPIINVFIPECAGRLWFGYCPSGDDFPRDEPSEPVHWRMQSVRKLWRDSF